MAIFASASSFGGAADGVAAAAAEIGSATSGGEAGNNVVSSVTASSFEAVEAVDTTVSVCSLRACCRILSIVFAAFNAPLSISSGSCAGGSVGTICFELGASSSSSISKVTQHGISRHCTVYFIKINFFMRCVELQARKIRVFNQKHGHITSESL